VAAEDTRALWVEFRETGDQALRDRLILTYAPLVKYVAGRLGSGLPAHVDENDLVSYGLLGLIGAIERYDPDRDIKFETYAIARIKGAIIDELRALDWRSSARSGSWRRSSARPRPTSRSPRRSGSRSRSSRTR
jgi:RNA polymerase sigma factor for flagellar operon FliA